MARRVYYHSAALPTDIDIYQHGYIHHPPLLLARARARRQGIVETAIN